MDIVLSHLDFYLAGLVAVVATVLAITNTNPVHALLYLIASLLAVAMIFFVIGAPFAGILEIIVYAGAVMVLFVFVVMMLNLGRPAIEQEKRWLRPGVWIGPTVLWAALLVELVQTLLRVGGHRAIGFGTVGPREVGIALFGPYLLAVELASMLLLAALVAAYHLGRTSDEK
ncbi:MAG TPA: NADH-quinone oxidoreductase subunit J [Nevskia sp.]|jgi:NADH-quinone oxidoreductase subunit J|nr:NADH-quinone oxidoreductase subunit J [Nevskia sp.]